MKEYTLTDLRDVGDYKIFGNTSYVSFNNIKPIESADKDSLVWIKKGATGKEEIAANTEAKIIVCDSFIDHEDTRLKEKTLIVVDDPRLTFIRIAEKLFSFKPEYGIHPHAFIDSGAKIADNVYIGAFSHIGKCEIESGTMIYSNVHLYDNVKVGKNVTIHSGTVIGSDGFGFQRNEKQEFEKFPHLGGVVIENNVEIGSNTSIDRGVLSDTLIKEGAKIDNLVHIAHNVIIGRHTAVIANSMIGGSTHIGDYCWIAPSVSILNGIKIGDKVTVGMSAVVTKNIPDGETWTGLPAKPLEEFVRLQKKLKELLLSK